MSNSYFQFKQFTIRQHDNVFKVGTDGVLLGAWCAQFDCQTVLDIGTGTGLIALMIAQQNPNAEITAIESNYGAFVQAQQNFSNSLWNNSVVAEHIAFQNYWPTALKKNDTIVCNPPFFSSSLLSPSHVKSSSKHDINLSLEELISGVVNLLSESGFFYVILPVIESEKCVDVALKQGIYLIEQVGVKSKPNKTVFRMLLRFSKIKMPLTESEIIIEAEKRHEYSQKFIEWVKPYYLNV